MVGEEMKAREGDDAVNKMERNERRGSISILSPWSAASFGVE